MTDPHHLDVWGCFSVENSEISEYPISISICVSTNDPYVVAFVHTVGSSSSADNYRLDFDSSQSVNRYRIDYLPDGIRFFINGKMLHELQVS